jgi:anti-anti-sigma factor
MKINELQHGAVTVIAPAGPLIDADADQFRDRLGELVRQHLGRVVVDAAGVTFVDSKGLEALVDGAEMLSSSGRSLKLCAANETVREVLDLTDLAGQFEQFEDVNAAVRSFL